LTGDALAYAEFDPMRALAILDDISRAIGSNLDLNATLDAILTSIGQSIQFTSAEVTLWHPESETLRPIRQNVRRTNDSTQTMTEEQPEAVYRMGEGYSGYIAMYRQPWLDNNVSGRSTISPKTTHSDFQSFVGVPLIVGDQFVGTLELTHKDRNAFTQQDLALLRSLDDQIASAIQAARLYNEQTSRVAELDGLQQIAQAMGQLDTPAQLYGQLSERIAHLLNVSICGVLLYDDDTGTFRSQPPFYGIPDTLIQHYRLTLIQGSELYTIWHNSPYWYNNAPSDELIQAMGFSGFSAALTIHAMALVPMTVGTRRIGLLLVANRRDEHDFNDGHMHLLMSFARQAAVVAENERLYHEEQRRNRELGGLQQIAQTMGVLRSTEELIGQITERIATLMEVEMCGVLLYDPKTRVLVSQKPFFGMDDPDQIDFYQLPSPPDSPVSKLWRDRDTWFSNNLRYDPLARDSDLDTLASQLGIRQTALATLFVGSHQLGVLQVANRQDGFEFTEDDARVLSIFAGQAAILIDNGRLYHEMQQRTHEAEGLRVVTEIASQAIPNDETVEKVLIAIANLLQTRVVSLALVEENSGDLLLKPEYVWGVVLPKEHRIDTYSPGFAESVLVSRRPFVSPDLRTDNRVLAVYKPLIQQLGLRDVIQVPLVIHDRSIGELTVANRLDTDEPFSDSDVQLLQAMATQLAAMVDRMRLYAATDQDLRARIQEMDALSRVSHELSQTLELDRILDVIRQESLRSTDASAASIVLLLPRKDWTADDEPVIERRFGESRALRELAPVEKAAVLRNDVIAIDDYNESEFEAIPAKTRSALVVPINYGDEVIGLIHMFSANPGVFGQNVIDFGLALTDQATVAIANAQRYQDQLKVNERLRIRAERMGRIFELGEMFRQGASLPEMLEEVAHSIQETIGFNVVLISLVDERENVLQRTAQAGLPLAVFEEMQKTTPPLTQARGLMQPAFKISNSYFLPAEGAEEVRDGLPVHKVLQEPMGEGPRAWNPEDLLLVPLYGSGERLIGLISVDEPRSAQRPDVNTIEALEIFGNQAAFSVENYRLIQRIREEAEATRRERDRLAQLHLVASEIQSAPDVPSRLQVVANGIHDAGWNHVVITLHDEHLEPTALIQSGYDSETAMRLSDEVLSGAVWRKWINDLDFHALKLGAGYYLRYTKPWVRKNVLKGKELLPAVAEDEWHPQDVFYLPLVGQDQKRIIGMIAMDGPSDGKVPTEASLQPFELFASQAAAAIETTRLYLETVRAAEQEQRINEVMEAVSGSISPQAIIQSVGRGLQQMVPFTRMGLAMYQPGSDHFDMLDAAIALDMTVTVQAGDPLDLRGTVMALVLREMRPRILQLERDKASRDTFDDVQAWYDDGERSTLLVPMIAGGQAVGVLHLGSELGNAFGFEENMELIQRLANLSAVALDNARLFEQAQTRAVQLDAQARRLGLLNRISNQLARALAAEEIYEIALQEMQEALGAAYGGVLIYDLDDETGRVILDTHPNASTDEPVTITLAEHREV
ncbi:MAG: GAF domain-containing protein, partial [Anaerolineae bacterium]|nr:GAF domain-containing protein [Anaerolineae bacterium]